MKIKDRGLPRTRGKPQFWEITAKRSRRIGWEKFIRVGTENKTLERFKQENPEYTVIKSIKEARILILQHRYLYLDFRDSSRFWVITAHYNKKAKPCKYIIRAENESRARRYFSETYPWLDIYRVNRTNFWCDGLRIYCDFG